MSDSYGNFASCLQKVSLEEGEREQQKILHRGVEVFEKLKKVEVSEWNNKIVTVLEFLRLHLFFKLFKFQISSRNFQVY